MSLPISAQGEEVIVVSVTVFSSGLILEREAIERAQQVLRRAVAPGAPMPPGPDRLPRGVAAFCGTYAGRRIPDTGTIPGLRLSDSQAASIVARALGDRGAAMPPPLPVVAGPRPSAPASTLRVPTGITPGGLLLQAGDTLRYLPGGTTLDLAFVSPSAAAAAAAAAPPTPPEPAASRGRARDEEAPATTGPAAAAAAAAEGGEEADDIDRSSESSNAAQIAQPAKKRRN
jgi:hypothetical protein